MTNTKKIMIADDDLRNRKLLETVLRIDGTTKCLRPSFWQGDAGERSPMTRWI